jgi:hypothetical protein
MDLIKEILDHGSQTLAAFKDNIPTLLAIIAISAIAASRWQRSRHDGEIRGVKAENKCAQGAIELGSPRSESCHEAKHETGIRNRRTESRIWAHESYTSSN